jgi:hypothetical protein
MASKTGRFKTASQTRGQTQIKAGLNAQKTHFERVYLRRIKKPGLIHFILNLS